MGDESWIGAWLVLDNNGFTNIAEDGLVSVVEPEPQEVLAVLNPLPENKIYLIQSFLNVKMIIFKHYFRFL